MQQGKLLWGPFFMESGAHDVREGRRGPRGSLHLSLFLAGFHPRLSYSLIHSLIHPSHSFTLLASSRWLLCTGSVRDPEANDRTMRNPPKENANSKTPTGTIPRPFPEGKRSQGDHTADHYPD